MKYKYQSRVATIANALFQSGEVATLSEAFIQAHKSVKLVQSLKEQEVTFTFRKKDGTKRTATGTLNASLFTYESKGVSRTNRTAQSYYDLQREAWRSYKIANLQSIAA